MTRSEIESLKRQNEMVAQRDAEERRKLLEIERRIAAAQSQLLRVRARDGQLWFIPEPSTDQREPVLVVVGGSGITVERFDQPQSRTGYSDVQADAGLRAYCGNLSRQGQFIVFLIRPSGIELFRKLRDQARIAGFQTGYDAISEEQLIHFGRPPDDSVTASATASPPVATPAGQTNAVPKAANIASNTPPTVPALTPPPPPTEHLAWWQRLLRKLGF